MWFKKDKNRKTKGGKNVYMLLDRSGSMATSWAETLGSINGYVEKLEDDVNVYVATFDTLDYTVVKECQARVWQMITESEVYPRGGTPLYDSAAKIMNRMVEDNPARAVLVIMTDGYENASREYDLAAVKARLKTLEKKDWPAVFLGADFSNVTNYATATFDMASANSLNLATGYRAAGMATMAGKTQSYFTATAFSNASCDSMQWTEQEKAAVDGSKTTVSNTVTKTTTTTTTSRQ